MLSISYCGQILVKIDFSAQIFEKKFQILNFTKIRLFGTELFRSNRRTDRHDEANSRFHNFGVT